MPQAIPSPQIDLENEFFLVCGLGSLGQHCVATLKKFGVKVGAIELSPPPRWEIENLPDLLDSLLIGDCRQSDVLKQAGIETCRAVLLVTDDERVNIEAAFAARLSTEATGDTRKIRLVIRSAKQNLNQLLHDHLGNFVAFEPTQLSAPAFALAALSDEILGFFELDKQVFQIVRHTAQPGDGWCNARSLYDLNSRMRRVLVHDTANSFVMDEIRTLTASQQFHQWEPETQIGAGDVLITLEPFQNARQLTPERKARKSLVGLIRRSLHLLRARRLQDVLTQFWNDSYQNQIRRVALLCGLTVTLLLALGTLLFGWSASGLNLLDGFYATAILLLGGFGDLFGQLTPQSGTPWWLRLFGFLLTLAGTAFVGVLYALLTEQLLTLRFQFLTRRPPIPVRDHVVVVGLGRVGKRVVALLQELMQPIAVIADADSDANALPELALVTGNPTESLAKVNLTTARSVVTVTEDEMQNLEIGLMTRAANPDSKLVIRTYDRRFSDNVAKLFPYAQVLCVSELSAEVFAAAAFGENVLGLFRLDQRTVMIMEYTIGVEDTLNGLLLAEVAYGYGVVPVSLQRSPTSPKVLFPSDEERLQPGNSLVVLASINGVKRIERNELNPRTWQVQIDEARSVEARFEGANAIARLSGCSIGVARDLIANLPGIVPVILYKHQAFQLVHTLARMRVKAEAIHVGDTGGSKPPVAPTSRA